MSDPRLELFVTPRDWFRHAVGRFQAAGLAYGHGATNAVDEAAYMILEGLHLPIDSLDPFADAKLAPRGAPAARRADRPRVTTRKPAAYLLNRAYIQGVPFYVDERVIVPRSFIGELLFSEIVGEGGLIDDPEDVERALDLCTGGGSLAILAAGAFPVRADRRRRYQRRRARRRQAQRRAARADRAHRAFARRPVRACRRPPTTT